MDPITAALLAAVSTGALSGLAETSKTTITEAYSKLKALLIKKCGATSDLVHAVNEIEAKPTSKGRQTTLQEEITTARADQDPDLRAAAQALLQLLQEFPQGAQYLQTATGSYIAQAEQGSSSSVNVGSPPQHPGLTGYDR